MSIDTAPIQADIDALYRATPTPRFVTVPRLRFICMEGVGDPEATPAYAEAIQALYAVAYTAKFALRNSGGPNVKVSPLEGLWWADDPESFLAGKKSEWRWTMMIRTPESITHDIVEHSRNEVAAKKKLPAARRLMVMDFEEGQAAQVLHIGPYASEGPTIARLHDFIRTHGFTFDDPQLRHHEIYLGDPRRCAPDRLRTIIRQPCTTPEPSGYDATQGRIEAVRRLLG